MRWIAVALLSPSWHASPIGGAEHAITPVVRFAARPPWFSAAVQGDIVREDLGEHADDEHAFCMVTEYETSSGSTASRALEDSESLNGHDQARSEIQSAVTTLWLVRRTSFGFDKIVLSEESIDGWVWREMTSHDERAPLASYASADLEPEDFPQAMQFASVLSTARPGGAIKTALDTLGLALTQRSWPLRFLALWLALEGLFGPTDARETTFRLCQRISLFLESRGPSAIELFGRVNKLYGWRSKTVHGMRLQNLKADDSEEIIEQTELLVFRALRKLLAEESLVRLFDSKNRETYLDQLALT